MSRKACETLRTGRALIGFVSIVALAAVVTASAEAQERNQIHSPIGPAAVKGSGRPDLNGQTLDGVEAVVGGTWNGMAMTPGSNPPDVHGAVGPSGVIAVVNSRIEYFTKAGAVIWGPTSFDSFQGAAGTSKFDPRAHYDPNSQRFVVVYLEYSSSPAQWLDIAVSKSNHPTTSNSTSWYFYRVPILETIGGLATIGDFPSVAVDAQGLYVAVYQARLPAGDTNPEHAVPYRPKMYCWSMASLVSGTLGTAFSYAFGDPSLPFLMPGPLAPVTPVGTGAPSNLVYLVEINQLATNSVQVFAVQNPLTATGSIQSQIVNVPDHGGPPTSNAPQLGTTDLVATGIGEQNVHSGAWWYQGQLWFSHAGGGSGPTIVYWYQIATNGFPTSGQNPSRTASGAMAGGSGVWNTYPALGVNAAGDVCIVYTQTSSSTYPRTMVSTRAAGAAGFTVPVAVKTSPTYFNKGTEPARWGDYLVAAADPADGSFWVGYEWANTPSTTAQNWATSWTNVSAPAGGWEPNGNLVKARPNQVDNARIARDGGGGAFIAWTNNVSGGGAALSRVGSSGEVPDGWPLNGITLSGAGAGVDIAADNSNGALVAWVSGSDVRVNRYTSAGAVVSGWPASGVTVGQGVLPRISSDGSGGALVTWSTAQYPGFVMVSKVTSAGAIASGWPTTGLQVSTSSGAFIPQIASDGGGGAFVGWYSQLTRVTSAGAIASGWPAGGLAVSVGGAPRLVPDGTGGVFVAAAATNSGSTKEVVKRITASGATQAGWPAEGRAVSSTFDWSGIEHAIATDGSGGVLIAWHDAGVLFNGLHVHRVDAGGALNSQWPAAGVLVSTNLGAQSTNIELASDGNGGALVSWQELRNYTGCDGPVNGCDYDIYSKRITSHGDLEPGMPTDGLATSVVLGIQENPVVALAGAGKAIVAWRDARQYPYYCPNCENEVYASLFTFDGVPPAAEALTPYLATCTAVQVSWTAPADDGATGSPAAAYDLRWSNAPITSANFEGANPVTMTSPATPGSSESSTPIDFGTCADVYFALRTRDDTWNWSPVTATGHIGTWCSHFGCEPDQLQRVVPEEFALRLPALARLQSAVTILAEIPFGLDGLPYELAVFDLVGRRVERIAKGTLKAGHLQQEWQPGDPAASGALHPGVYYVRLQTPKQTLMRKIVLLF